MKTKNKPFAVGIAGSPRKRGNSTALLRAYLDGVKSAGFSTKLIHLNDYTYKGCQACDQCVKGKPCPVNDELNAVFPDMQRARIWAMASPIYYDAVSGQLKMFFDRLRFTTHAPNGIKGPHRGILIITYEDKRRKEYLATAKSLAGYFNWGDRKGFGKVRVIAAPNLGPRDAWKTRSALLEKLKKTGEQQARGLS